MQNMINYLDGNSTRRLNGKAFTYKNGQAQRWVGGDSSPDAANVQGEWTADMEAQLQKVAEQHPEYKRQPNESRNAWTARINNELGRGGNRGDKGSKWTQTQGTEYKVSKQTDTQNMPA